MLPVAVWPAANGPPKAVILGLHGFGDYRKAWDEPAEIWAKAGITTYSYDQRGFGKSPTRGRWPGTEALVDDAKAIAVLLRTQYPGVPLYLAGESMGGAVALVAANQGIEVDGLILASAALRSRDTFGPVVSAGLWFVAHTVPWFPNGPTSIDFQPTDNPEDHGQAAERSDDAARGTGGHGIRAGRPDGRRARRGGACAPALSDAARAGRPHRAARTGARGHRGHAAQGEFQARLLQDGYHLLLRDKEGKVVAQDVVAWISDHEAALPSGAEAPATRSPRSPPSGDRSAAARAPRTRPAQAQRMTTEAAPRTTWSCRRGSACCPC